MSEKRTAYDGVFSQYAEPIVSDTTATNATASVISWRALNEAATVCRRFRNCCGFTSEPRYLSLYRHSHDVLIRLHELVAHLDGELQRHFRSLQRDHRL